MQINDHHLSFGLISPLEMNPYETALLSEFDKHPEQMHITDDGNIIYVCPRPGLPFLFKIERLEGRDFHSMSDGELDILLDGVLDNLPG